MEDLDDDRAHTFDENEPQPTSYGRVETAGVRDIVPIHELSKIFYADTGKILNIGNEGETNAPVLLLKRDLNAVPPRRMADRYDDADESAEQAYGPQLGTEVKEDPRHTPSVGKVGDISSR